MRRAAFGVPAIRRLSAMALALTLGPSAPASATDFYINQQSVRGQGRVDAGNTVAADDLSTIFFNPAGLIELWHDDPSRRDIQIEGGVHLILPFSDQVNRGSTAATPGTRGVPIAVSGGNAHNPTDPTPVPTLYVAKPLKDGRAAFGLGMNAPFGLATTFSPDWYGRYDATEASLRTFNVSLVGSDRLTDRLSVGGGLDIEYARASLSSAIPNPLTPGGPTPATDGSINTVGHDYAVGFNAGLIYAFGGGTRVGIHYRSAMNHAIDGTSTVAGLTGPLAEFNGAVGAHTDLNLPAITAVGVSQRVTRPLVLLGEFEWFNWSTFQEIRIRFADGRPDGVRPANYTDAYATAFGAEYGLESAWTIRGGIHYDTTPTVDGFRETTAPDSERLWLGFGASLRKTSNLSFDFAFNHAFFSDTTVAVTRTFFDNTPLATKAVINGDVKTAVNTVAVDLRYRF